MSAMDANAGRFPPPLPPSVPPSLPPPLPGWPPAPYRMPPPGPPTGRFLGGEGAFFGLLARGSVLLLCTLGIYRFWLATDVRRFLWGNTEIAGDTLEYSGTALELLLGFLIAIALLLPINALIFLATFASGILKYAGGFGFVLLFVLGQFAVFRARRYRLTRTIYRGVRFYQTGSAVRYALMSTLWTLLIIATFGLAYPWAQASLERYKLRHTHYGTLDGHFAGSGTRLFLRGVLLWVAVMGPFIAATTKAIATIDWTRLANALDAPDKIKWDSLDTDYPELFVGGVALVGGIAWAVLAALVLYPSYRAIVQRWWIAGIRIGPIAATSALRTGQIYRAYLRMLGYGFLFALGASAVLGVVGFSLAGAVGTLASAEAVQITVAVFGVVSYMATMLGYSAIYQRR